MALAVYDVVIVGGGGSGLAAAIEARAAGASVILLEKNAKLGGSTANRRTLRPQQLAGERWIGFRTGSERDIRSIPNPQTCGCGT
jgi:flavin-dependent dehydrogenase